MATKRFDDATEQARALEAKAKKLRREAQAARTKAYADALVTVFPEVKDMGKPISVDKRRGFEGDGAAAPSQADGVGQIARIAICTYEVNACSFPLCARALRN